MKVITIVGARPQFVKAAVVSRELKRRGVNELIIHTGQHYDHAMSEVFFEEMEIPKPAVNLGINGKDHGAMTGAMLAGIEEVLIKEKPDMVLVYGDTNSTLAGTLAAKKLHISVAHVEAGLRSFNMAMPEEVNRILTDRISDLLFAPTDAAVANLKKEGFDHFNSKVIRTGDVMQDAAIFYAEKAGKGKLILDIELPSKFALCTIHRAENTDDPARLKSIFAGLDELNKTIPVVLPMHPRTASQLKGISINTAVTIIDPVGYFDMIRLLQQCRLVLTDSGGLQKEAYFFRKNCVTLRDQTEWVELVDNGVNVLAGASAQKIIDSATVMLTKNFTADGLLYGGGEAAQQIVETLISFHSKS